MMRRVWVDGEGPTPTFHSYPGSPLLPSVPTPVPVRLRRKGKSRRGDDPMDGVLEDPRGHEDKDVGLLAGEYDR